jgi:acyl-CoA thioesterase-1
MFISSSMGKILFFGDSLTAGYGLFDPARESFPGLIQEKINAAKLPFEVINAGVSGDTSAGGLARLDYWLHQPIDVFILELGINDVMRGVPPQATLANLDSIVVTVKRRYPKAKLALMGMELPAFIPGTLVSDFKAIFRKLAEAHQMLLIPFFLEGVLGQSHLNLHDGLHPSAAGYKVIANNVWPALKTFLDREV